MRGVRARALLLPTGPPFLDDDVLVLIGFVLLTAVLSVLRFLWGSSSAQNHAQTPFPLSLLELRVFLTSAGVASVCFAPSDFAIASTRLLCGPLLPARSDITMGDFCFLALARSELGKKEVVCDVRGARGSARHKRDVGMAGGGRQQRIRMARRTRMQAGRRITD